MAFEKIGERVVHEGAVVTFTVGTFRSPDGVVLERDVVKHPGAVSVVPVDGDDVILVRQYRAALGRDLLEIPAGKRDVPGEPPEATAVRELEEEIGMRAATLVPLAEFYNSAGFSDEYSYVYLATDLEAGEQSLQGVEEQHMTVERHRLADVPAMIAAHELVDAKTIIGLLLALRHMGR
ncbi:MAG: NUDIX hydrolase [Acidimicrobiales bacterium]|nr:NUDIX hydrolase [Acidimicrobiales bacterium]